MVVDDASGDTAGLRTFDEAKSTLYGTISRAGEALESASRRRESTVTSVAAFLDRIQQLDVSGLSVIHVTGTKGKGSTCALVESVLRRHGFRTGLYTSPHLLEVTERVRCHGKPLSKEAFAKYFFEVWDRLQATTAATTTTTTTTATTTTNAAAAKSKAADMPTYFHLLTLVGLWCFVQEGVDVCVLEVGMGGRFDATNVVPSPVACGVTVLDLDHTQILGDTLDKIAWEKGGIFKRGCRAMTVEQPRGGMSVLREARCAEEAGCSELEVVKPLPARDPSGRAYEIGLAGEHQRINAGLALRLCLVWMEARQQKQQQQQQQHPVAFLGGIDDPQEAFWGSANVHRGLSDCVWPGRCQVFRSPAFPSVTVYLDGAHTEQSIAACLEWFVENTTRAAAAAASTEATSPTSEIKAAAPTPDGIPRPPTPPPPPHSKEKRQTRQTRRVLWFNASHERDVVPLLGPLASARKRVPCRRSRRGDDDVDVDDGDGSNGGVVEGDDNDDEVDAPLFDDAWFMEVNLGRPSRFTPPTVQEILSPLGVSPAAVAHAGAGHGGPPDAEEVRRREVEEKEGKYGGAEAKAGAWQRTLQQVWISLQTRRGGRRSATLTGTASEFVGKMSSISGMTTPNKGEAPAGAALGDRDELRGAAAKAMGGSGSAVAVEVLCTGSLYAVAAALEAFGADVV
ncbi:unnamed protein product [Pylaiella littoralis]